ncbi:MAG: phosphoribosylamine--glycine ligase [Candidatus Glassbacteria bacterium]
MKILIIGNGGREHTLLWKLRRDEPDAKFFITIGNGGTRNIAESIQLDPTDIDGIVEFSKREKIDLVVVGPERPLELGLTDRLNYEGISVFGPSREAARIETSKAFAKRLMKKYGIPTASFETFTSYEEAVSFVKSQDIPLVVKASGLAAGKGSVVCDNRIEALEALETIMVRKAFGDAGDEVVVEERLEGEELSFFVLTDGERALPLSPSQDHKRAYDGDRGLNTGGMGAYAPVSVATPSLTGRIMRDIITPTVSAMREEGMPYRGVLYAGLMLTAEGPMVIEFNARFGDPEAQVNLPLLKSNLVSVMSEICSGELEAESLDFRDDYAVCVVMASGGYPGSYEKGKVIHLPDGLESDKLMVFHAGTTVRDDTLLTSGGRVLGVTALGKSIGEARERCYDAIGNIHFDRAHFRTDIAYREMARAGA